MSSAVGTRTSTGVLELAVEQVLASVRPTALGDPVVGARRAEESLRDALRDAGPVEDNLALQHALACAEAACEHLKYAEIQEARTLLTAARGQLVLAHEGV
ncbi:hypothetical protein OG205_00275 [Lentzea sp. NBC_00516]|uniref:hypothetical protein n=1 Tax=Lentzea sp. NBC_00516 TaxID=2903582 RepID=UPI002E811BDB|nr:hypothetical protein [Lentzea sp. NBC_00516]WUD25469.1 hypothetical protein OG205_00275 [Lentzea sp. NBC_00516]